MKGNDRSSDDTMALWQGATNRNARSFSGLTTHHDQCPRDIRALVFAVLCSKVGDLYDRSGCWANAFGLAAGRGAEGEIQQLLVVSSGAFKPLI